MNVSLGAPAALFWLALAGPIIALYIARVRLRRVPVSTSLFWKQIYEEKPPQSLWQSLRHWLSLLLQLLLLCLLALAVADPYLPGQLKKVRRTVLVVDRSASMQAHDIEPTRFAAAISDAQNDVDGMRPGDEMAIVLADTRPKVEIGMSSHVSTLHRTLRSLQPHDGPAELQPALELARQLIGNHPHGRILVFTDGCVDEVQSSESAVTDAATDSVTVEGSAVRREPEIQFRLFAEHASNVGVTRFQVRRSLVDPLGYETLVQVTNSSDQTVQCRLEVELDGLPVDILPLTLQSDEVWSRTIEKTSVSGGLLSARLTEVRADDSNSEYSSAPEAAELNRLEIDDTAWAVVPDRKVQKVLIVTGGNLFLQKVFEASPLAAVEVIPKLPESWPQDTLVVLHQLTPPEIPTGNVLIIDPTGNSDLWVLGESLVDPIVADQDAESQLMTHVRLDTVLLRQLRRFSAVGATHVLAATAAGDPVYVELIRDGGRCLLLTASLNESDLAFRTAFPIMISNALAWFAGSGGELSPAAATGDVVTIGLEPSRIDRLRRNRNPYVELLHPRGGRTRLTLSAVGSTNHDRQRDDTTIGPLNESGLYRILKPPMEAAAADNAPPDGAVIRTIAVNVSSRRESDLRPSDALRDSQTGQTVAADGLNRPLWYYLALLACALAVTEWILYQRRFTE